MIPEPKRALIVLLHGVGSSGRDMSGLGRRWSTDLPAMRFAAPDGPEAFHAGGGGRQWFSVEGITTANRPERVMAARVGFDAVVGDVIAAHGLQRDLDRVALVGFSQGAIMALDAVASGRWPVGAVVGFSGRLASPLPLSPSLATPVLLLHGDADPVMPGACMAEAVTALRAAGMQVDGRMLPRLGHAIDAAGLAIAGDFLKARFACS